MIMLRKIIFSCLLCIFAFSISAKNKIKVACVGDSVTYGAGIEDREKDSYPSQLQSLLGDEYLVGNFGRSGSTLINRGFRPYTKQEEYRKALDYKADIVVIHLGLNDTDPRCWPNFRDDFVKDYLSLIRSFRESNPKVRIWICRLTPIFSGHPRFISGTRDWYWQIQEKIESIASSANTGLIDLHYPLYLYPNLMPDNLHPSSKGAGMIALNVYRAITGDFGGLQMSVIYSDNMVLQRNVNLEISGIANAGEMVKVSFDGQERKALADEYGKWTVNLNPIQARKGLVLCVETSSKKLEFRNVSVGEVWLCSGQSNMSMKTRQIDDNEKNMLINRLSGNNNIRLFNMRDDRYPAKDAWSQEILDEVNSLGFFGKTTWEVCNAENISEFSAIASSFGLMLSDSLDVPVGLILNSVGGSTAEAWIDRKTLEFEFPAILNNWKNNDFIQAWVRERAKQNTINSTDKLQRHQFEPSYLFDAGIRPLENYSIKGVIWYQGESNTHNPEAYQKLFSLMLMSWRNFLDNPRLPFYYVQLSSMDRPSWPYFRDMQRRIEGLNEYCRMVVSSDLGDSLNVHPKHKTEIGSRLGLSVLKNEYSFNNIEDCGPVFQRYESEDGELLVSFSHSKGLRTSDSQEVRGFEILYNDGLWYPSEAKIRGNSVVLSYPKSVQPQGVRYGWQPFTRANLVNGALLPASTFSSTP